MTAYHEHRTISDITTNAADMMKYVNEQKSPIFITQNGKTTAVLMDITTYQETQDAFTLLNIIKIAEKDIENSKIRNAQDIFSELYSTVNGQ